MHVFLPLVPYTAMGSVDDIFIRYALARMRTLAATAQKYTSSSFLV